MLDPLPTDASLAARAERYDEVFQRIVALLDGETDTIAALSTVVAELHHAFSAFHWTGFYRVDAPDSLVIGPYQGGHGCLRISFDRGVCGAAARTREPMVVADVEAFPGHIACSTTTRSEIVVPVVLGDRVLGVLDIDSDLPAMFDDLDSEWLQRICAELASDFSDGWAIRR